MNEKAQENYADYKNWDVISFGQYQKHWAAYFKAELNNITVLSGCKSSEGIRVIEIGYGNGAFLGWARDNSFEVAGVEILPSRLLAAEQAGFDVANTIESLTNGSSSSTFHGAVAFDVFEHLEKEDLRLMLKQLHAALDVNGWIIARVPNGDSPFARHVQHGDLTHKSALGSDAFRQLAIESGFKTCITKPHKMPLTGVGVVRGSVYFLARVVSLILEFPVQLLLNSYAPGPWRWYILNPNMMVYLAKRP
jgi:hypothetical protein